MADALASGGDSPGRPPLRLARRLSASVALGLVVLLPLARAAGDVSVPKPTAVPADTRAEKPLPPPNASGAPLVPKTIPGLDGGIPLLPPSDPEQIERDLQDIKSKAARIARAKNQRSALRARVTEILDGRPMDHELKQELVRHARRVARLERARALAKSQKDDPSAERATKLLDKENARHDKWMGEFDARTAKGATP